MAPDVRVFPQVRRRPADTPPMEPESAEPPASPFDTVVPRAAETLAAVSARLVARPKVDPALFRVVEVVRAANGRLTRHGQIWHRDLDHVRRFGRALAANSAAQKVQVADAAGAVIETIPPPPPGTPAPGWGDWRAQAVPPMPARPRAVMAPTKTPAMTPAKAPPALPPMMDVENEVETTRPLPPGAA
jgi:hypothetical protein